MSGNELSGPNGLKSFLKRRRPAGSGDRTAVSLFSGAGLSDLGYELAGFRLVVQVEADRNRAQLGQDNFPESRWITDDVRSAGTPLVRAYKSLANGSPDLLVATPPCQGMSSSNPSRGRRQTPRAKLLEEKNRLILEVVPVARALQPRIIVAENVRQVLTLRVTHEGQEGRVIDLLAKGLPEYELFNGVVDMAEHGVPQVRRRAIVVAVRRDQPWLDRLKSEELLPWPRPTHSECPSNGERPWITLRQWLKGMAYERLDSSDPKLAKGRHPLHFVPHYGPDRYLLVRDIPAHSGRSAYESDTCPNCSFHPVPEGLVTCPSCGSLMRNRPYTFENGNPRLIKGFESSYRRMDPNRPAYTITTNSSHVGSDFKIHPWENRVLSSLECADLQTVPRFYDWSRALTDGRSYLIRNAVGEALPTYFTWLHGKVLGQLLSGRGFPRSRLAQGNPRQGVRGVKSSAAAGRGRRSG